MNRSRKYLLLFMLLVVGVTLAFGDEKQKVELTGFWADFNTIVLLDCRPTALNQMMPPRIIEDGKHKMIVQRGECRSI